MSDEITFSYVGRENCGCITFAMIDDPAYAKETAREVAKVIRSGRLITRMTTKEALADPLFFLGKCPHKLETPT